MYLLKISGRSRLKQLRINGKIIRVHWILKEKISFKDSVPPPFYNNKSLDNIHDKAVPSDLLLYIQYFLVFVVNFANFANI